MRQLQNVTTYVIYSLILFLFLLHFLERDSMVSDCILIFVYLYIDFNICKTLYRLLKICLQNFEEDRKFVYSFNLKNELWKIIWNKHLFLVFLFFSFLILYKNVVREIMIMFLIFIPVAVDHRISYPNKKEVLEANNLHIGYGAALVYYKNYLKLTMPYHFNERIDSFKSFNRVDLRKTLFILVPESCRILRYLDSSEDENIERCQELPKVEITHGGVKNRVYNITVYQIRTNANSKGLRMAVEYAQPLKELFAYKEKGFITEIEMFYQRKLFVKTLKEFLRENNDIYEFCEIIEYDDSKRKVSEVLLDSYYNSHETV